MTTINFPEAKRNPSVTDKFSALGDIGVGSWLIIDGMLYVIAQTDFGLAQLIGVNTWDVNRLNGVRVDWRANSSDYAGFTLKTMLELLNMGEDRFGQLDIRQVDVEINVRPR